MRRLRKIGLLIFSFARGASLAARKTTRKKEPSSRARNEIWENLLMEEA